MKLANIQQVFLLSQELNNLIKQRDWLQNQVENTVRLKVVSSANAGAVYVEIPTNIVLHHIDERINAVRVELIGFDVKEVGLVQ